MLKELTHKEMEKVNGGLDWDYIWYHVVWGRIQEATVLDTDGAVVSLKQSDVYDSTKDPYLGAIPSSSTTTTGSGPTGSSSSGPDYSDPSNPPYAV